MVGVVKQKLKLRPKKEQHKKIYLIDGKSIYTVYYSLI